MNFNNKTILNLLGPFQTIEMDGYKINLDDEYAFIFYSKEEDLNIDFNKKLGLIIFNNGVNYFLDLKENVNYKSYSELIDKFPNNYLLAIGDKKK